MTKIKIILFFIIQLLFLSCFNSKHKDEMQLNASVFYVLKDSFLGTNDKCRILINIPQEGNHKYDCGEELILCMKNEDGKLIFSHIFNGFVRNDECCLKTTIIGSFKEKEVSVEPDFSPIAITQKESNNLVYKEGQSIILSITLKSRTNKNLEFVKFKQERINNEEPIFVK
ncbi:MAG: hypothetical protein Q8862_08215 [Bacteroidota bacterium]|nr:hypothetical protein [Bacteroidota bacterium]